MANTTTTPTLKGPQANFLVRLLVVLFALTYISSSLYFVVDTWIHNERILRCVLGVDAGTALSPLFVAGVHAVVGSVLGAGVLDLVSSRRYVAVEKGLRECACMGLLHRPLARGGVGINRVCAAAKRTSHSVRWRQRFLQPRGSKSRISFNRISLGLRMVRRDSAASADRPLLFLGLARRSRR